MLASLGGPQQHPSAGAADGQGVPQLLPPPRPAVLPERPGGKGGRHPATGAGHPEGERRGVPADGRPGDVEGRIATTLL